MKKFFPIPGGKVIILELVANSARPGLFGSKIPALQFCYSFNFLIISRHLPTIWLRVSCSIAQKTSSARKLPGDNNATNSSDIM